MTDRLFGTDGVRGLANVHPMTAEMALQVGRAAGYLFQNGDRQHTFLIGKDTRRSCYMLENALTAGLCSMGARVLLTGPLPTPGVSYIMRSLRCDGAVMISASHNGYADNGIKIFGADGYKIPDSLEDRIAACIASGEMDAVRPTGERIGTAKRHKRVPSIQGSFRRSGCKDTRCVCRAFAKLIGARPRKYRARRKS